MVDQLNLLDLIFGGTLLGVVLLGCTRGNGRESLHTFLFGLAMFAGWLFLRSGPMPTDAAEVARLLLTISFYTVAMYAFSFVVTALLSPIILDGAPPGLRSRFWGGAHAMAKLAVAVLGVNLWYALHSPLPQGERLQLLPPILSQSVLIRLSDRVTLDVQDTLADLGLLPAPTLAEDEAVAPLSETEPAPAPAL